MTDFTKDPVDLALSYDHANQHLDKVQLAVVEAREELMRHRDTDFAGLGLFFEETETAYWALKHAEAVLAQEEGSAT